MNVFKKSMREFSSQREKGLQEYGQMRHLLPNLDPESYPRSSKNFGGIFFSVNSPDSRDPPDPTEGVRISHPPLRFTAGDLNALKNYQPTDYFAVAATP